MKAKLVNAKGQVEVYSKTEGVSVTIRFDARDLPTDSVDAFNAKLATSIGAAVLEASPFNGALEAELEQYQKAHARLAERAEELEAKLAAARAEGQKAETHRAPLTPAKARKPKTKSAE